MTPGFETWAMLLVFIQLWGGAKLRWSKTWASSRCLALTLFVARVFADDHDATVTTDDLALVANLLDAWVNLHVSYFFLGFLRTVYL